ncbi:MAG: hypothetical protein CMK09_04625 [Ponticaulis sp.]|nr:hypothetical protein [Ponticaulis sp.]|tara:strand:- start:7592 stop:9397 length:1806 start_codon:yes stop_codon:yes gene_type:complete
MTKKHWLTCSMAAFALLLPSCSSASDTDTAYVPAPETLTEIEQGQVTGVRDDEIGVVGWFGIPFAEPPVGELRWRAPRPAAPLTEALSATEPTKACLQINSPQILPGEEGELVGDEDCLYLNIWAPAAKADAPRPVMVWVHGGGNATGFAGQSDFGRLAAREGVIVVALNYRLGPMGWFSHEALRQTAETELDRSMNFGLLDLIEGLKWVNVNVSNFGGDPERITLFGESAGGFNTAALMMSPLTEGLFDGAIIQSAGFSTYTLEEAETGPKTENDRRGASSSEALVLLREKGEIASNIPDNGATLAKLLRGLRASAIFDAYLGLTESDVTEGQIGNIDSTADGVVLPFPELDNAGNDLRIASRDIPLIIGTNRDETRVYALENPAFTNKYLGVFFQPKDRDAYIASGEYPSRLWASLGVHKIAEIRSQKLTAPTYTYRFDWDEQGKYMFTDFSLLIGAMHSIDVNFLSGDFRLAWLDDKMFFKPATESSRRALSHDMMAFWGAFARSLPGGELKGVTVADWPAWSEGQKTLVLDTKADGGIRTESLRDTPEQIIAEFVSDPRFLNDKQRCEIAGVMKLIAQSQSYPTDRFDELADQFCEA